MRFRNENRKYPRVGGNRKYRWNQARIQSAIMSKEDQADHTRGYDCCDFGNTSHIMGECPLCIDNMNKYNNEDGARMGGLKGDEHLGDRKGKE